MTAILFVSCQKQNQTTTVEKVVKTTSKEMSQDGFLFKKVVRGDTIWGYSEQVYGTGIEWRQIVSENPFLGEPGRIYYNDNLKKWIVIIYPGEIIRIGGSVITPTFVSEETFTTTTTATEIIGIPWWGWLLIVLGGIIALFFLLGCVGLISYERQSPRSQVVEYCPRTPYLSYTCETNGNRRLRVEGMSDTSIVQDSKGNLDITVRQY